MERLHRVPAPPAGQESSSFSTSSPARGAETIFYFTRYAGSVVIARISLVVMTLGVFHVLFCCLSILFSKRSPPGFYLLSDRVVSFFTAEVWSAKSSLSLRSVCPFTSQQVPPIENSFNFDEVLLHQFSLLWIALRVLVK